MTKQDHKAGTCRVDGPDQAAFEKLADALAPLMHESGDGMVSTGGYIHATNEVGIRRIVREEIARALAEAAIRKGEQP